MLLIKIVVAALLIFGLYTIAKERIGFPSAAAVRAVSRFGGKKLSSKERLINPIAEKIKKFICLDEHRKRELARTLKSAGINSSPEFYVASAAANAGIILLLAFAVLPFVPIASPFIIAFAVYSFFKDIHAAKETLAKKRAAIENEIQQFTSAIVQALGRSRDLFDIISAYRRIAGKELGKELDILITEMRTGNRGEALSNFENRISSPLVSELVRGLVGVDRGDDMTAYLTAVELHAKDLKISCLKKEAAKRPEKLAVASFALFGAMIAMYAAVMAVQLISSYHSLM